MLLVIKGAFFRVLTAFNSFDAFRALSPFNTGISEAKDRAVHPAFSQEGCSIRFFASLYVPYIGIIEVPKSAQSVSEDSLLSIEPSSAYLL